MQIKRSTHIINIIGLIVFILLSVWLYAQNKELTTTNTTLEQELKKSKQTATQSANPVSSCAKELKQTQISNTP